VKLLLLAIFAFLLKDPLNLSQVTHEGVVTHSDMDHGTLAAWKADPTNRSLSGMDSCKNASLHALSELNRYAQCSLAGAPGHATAGLACDSRRAVLTLAIPFNRPNRRSPDRMPNAAAAAPGAGL
jgi:hypothetical protein